MKVNADFDQIASAHTAQMQWIASPMPGVSRRMLDRIGDEVARATSIVRYDAGSSFSPHTHSGGEEFIVLDGVFQDEHGDFPVGTYVRNPIGTSHQPASEPGCEIFVKLWQFDPAEKEILRVDTETLDLVQSTDNPDVSQATIFADQHERVDIQLWQPGANITLSHPGGLELLVLKGSFTRDDEGYSKHDWLRLPRDASIELTAGDSGARVWLKTGHLTNINVPYQK
jgi:anti-sigma factor ChrR (cupin superfamily)